VRRFPVRMKLCRRGTLGERQPAQKVNGPTDKPTERNQSSRRFAPSPLIQPYRESKVLNRLFVSAKTTRAIPVRCALFENALVQASLDPQVRAIEPFPRSALSPRPREPAAVLVRVDGRFVLRVEEATTHSADAIVPQGFGTDGSALPEIVLTEADLRSEPRCSNTRLAWSYRRRRVSAGLRFQITQTLREDGPMTLAQLMSVVRILGNSAGPVLALACADLIELDLGAAPLGPATVARYRA
jgi:hypothetical protein